jgi:GLPGLI family protein
MMLNKRNVCLTVRILPVGMLLLIAGSVFAQQQPYPYNIEVIYKMTFQSDSANKNSVESEFVSLFIGNEQSLFCASNYLLMDSAIMSEAGKGNTMGPSMGFFQANGTHNSTVVFKTPNEMVTYDKVARFLPDVYKYTEPKDQFTWKILPDTLSIGGFVCQRAESTFGNRKWIAWFAPAIPVSEGPYKFHGLPGLIFNINDDQQYWNFNLASLRKRDTVMKVSFYNKIPKPLKDKKAFLEQKRYSLDNRFQLMKLKGTVWGNEEIAIKNYKEQAKKDNNWIELYKSE